MDRFTAALRRSTRQKFARMGRTALFYADPATVNPRIITVCITDRFTAAGDQKGTSFNSAELEIESPMIEFLLDQVTPKRNAYVAVQRGLVYQIDTVLPSDDITMTARALRLNADKLRNYPVPSERLIDEVAVNPDLIANQPQVLPAWMKDDWR